MGLGAPETAKAKSVKKISEKENWLGDTQLNWGDGEKRTLLKADHIGSKWSSLSSDSSPSWSSPTPRYAAGAFRGLDLQTKSQPSCNTGYCTRIRLQAIDSAPKAKQLLPFLCCPTLYGTGLQNLSWQEKHTLQTSYLVLKALGILMNSMQQCRADPWRNNGTAHSAQASVSGSWT